MKDKDFVDIGLEVGSLVEKKNKAYGDSFSKSGKLLEILYPDGIHPVQYKDMLAVVRIIDKLFRIATDASAFNEDPWRDICGYALLSLARKEKEEDAAV